jgi:PBSX family phage terminase large subunit
MTAAVQQPVERQVVRYAPYGGARELFLTRALEVCLDGPAGTGKTVAALNKVHLALLKYPNARALVARKTNVDLAASALVTYQQNVLHPGDGVTYFGGNKVKPAAFRYPNGSEMIVTGLDKPEKVKSQEYDLAYVNEATECDEEDIEQIRSRLRNGKMPYRQLMMDCNPGAPHHWLNQRMNTGTTTRLLSRHQDNPRYYDRVAEAWTAEGEAYINEVLGGLTGVRFQRLALGKWVSAEGLVYDEWDASLHIVPRTPIPGEWPRYLALDFGYTNPFVAQWWAQDPDGRLILYREYVQTKRTVDQHAAEVKRLSHGEPMPRVVIADPEDADGRAMFTRVTGWPTIAAHKEITSGVQAVKARLRQAGDGRPRLQVMKGALVHRDPELMAAKKPIGFCEEVESLVWDTRNNRRQGEEPMPGDDHALDTARYMVAHFDLAATGVTYAPSIY